MGAAGGEQMVTDGTMQTLARCAVLVVELEECLTVSGIVGDDFGRCPLFDDMVPLGRQLFEEGDGSVAIAGVVVLDTVLEEQGHPTVDNQDVGEGGADPFVAGGALGVETVVVDPIGRGAEDEAASQLVNGLNFK